MLGRPLLLCVLIVGCHDSTQILVKSHSIDCCQSHKRIHPKEWRQISLSGCVTTETTLWNSQCQLFMERLLFMTVTDNEKTLLSVTTLSINLFLFLFAFDFYQIEYIFLCYLFHSSCKFNQTHFNGSHIDSCVFMLYWLLPSSTVRFYFTLLLFKFWATERGFILWVCN